MPALISRLLPYWKAAAALALVWLGWHAHAVVTAARHAKALQQEIDARKVAENRAAEIGRDQQQAQDRLAARNRDLDRRAAHETSHPAYHAVLPEPGRLLYDAACCGAGAGEPDGPVPAADAPR